jgi:hypothetical protein
LAASQFAQTMDIVERSLGEFDGPFFMSTSAEGPTFVDVLFIGIFERVRASVAYWRNIDVYAGRPKIREWFDAMMAWEPFAKMASDDLSLVLGLPPQFGNVKFTAAREDISTLIDRQRSLAVLNDGAEGAADRMDAAAAMLRNADILLADALKGGKARADDKPHVDGALRAAVAALADPGPGKLEALEAGLLGSVPLGARKAVADCIRFERGRACTPRDMPFKALQQYCGVCNWVLRTLDAEL